MKASLDLIKKLRAQLPPEAADQLDVLESMAGEEGEAEEGAFPNEAPDDEMPMIEGESEGGGMDSLRDTLDSEDEPEDELMPDESEGEGTDEPTDVNAVAKSKKKAKKPSFWG